MKKLIVGALLISALGVGGCEIKNSDGTSPIDGNHQVNVDVDGKTVECDINVDSKTGTDVKCDWVQE